MAIETHDLVVHFPGTPHPTLDGITMTIPDGSFTVLVGASGSGKSTLLHCLAGLTTATVDRSPTTVRSSTAPGPRRGVAFQRDVLVPLDVGRGQHRFRARRAQTAREGPPAHGSTNCSTWSASPPEVAGQRPSELSGGMRQRVSIARVLAGEPEVMLMDEPFAALDALTRLRMQDLLIDLWTRLGRTVVFVTHDIDEAIRLGDTIKVLRGGGIAEHIVNPLSRPRPADSLADLPGYSELRKTLHHQLGIDHALH